MTDSWEERMAAKAEHRRAVKYEQWLTEARAEHAAEQEGYIKDYIATLTYEQAKAEQEWSEANPVGCACIGGPVCCRIRYEARKRILND